MATAPYSDRIGLIRSPSIGVKRAIVSGGFTAAIVFLLCWLGTFAPISSPTHAYISLFTAAEARSFRALCDGMLWSLVFGGLVGGIFALIYDATGRLGRR
jgi:hypothetical protein